MQIGVWVKREHPCYKAECDMKPAHVPSAAYGDLHEVGILGRTYPDIRVNDCWLSHRLYADILPPFGIAEGTVDLQNSPVLRCEKQLVVRGEKRKKRHCRDTYFRAP